MDPQQRRHLVNAEETVDYTAGILRFLSGTLSGVARGG